MNFRFLAVPIAAALLAAPAVSAQEAELSPAPLQATGASLAVPAPASAPDSAAGPTIAAAAVGAHRASSTAVATSFAETAAARRGYGQAQAMMIVGGVAVLTGLVIGNGAGYAIAVGGAVVGLYGLYQYLQ